MPPEAPTPLDVPLYYDFASTICYVTHRVLPRLADDLDALGVRICWQPIDLSLITGWPRGARIDGPRRENALRVARDFGVPVRMPPTWLDSRRAHALALALGDSPQQATWCERVWTAIFEEGRDLSEPGEVIRAAADIGIDAEPLLAAPWLTRLEEDTCRARDAGVNGVPVLVLGSFLLPGLQDEHTTRTMLRRFVERSGRAGSPSPRHRPTESR